MFLGVKVMQKVQQSKFTPATLTDFYMRCQKCLRVACGEMKKCFDFDDAPLVHIACLSPATATDVSVYTHESIATSDRLNRC